MSLPEEVEGVGRGIDEEDSIGVLGIAKVITPSNYKTV